MKKRRIRWLIAGMYDKHDKTVDWLIKNPEKFMRAWLDGYDRKKKPLRSNDEEYLTVDQYDYARKTGDWESGKTFNHRKDQPKISFSNVATIIEDICYGEADEEIFSIQDLLEFLNRNKASFVVPTDYEEDTTNEKL